LQHGAQIAILYALSLVAGMILALIYWSPLATRFQRRTAG
jgi:hypothetical protein